MRFRAIYFGFLWVCAIAIFLPLLYVIFVGKPIKMVGMFGGRNNGFLPEGIQRVLFHTITSGLVIYFGWYAVLQFIKDRLMLKGSTSIHRFPISIHGNDLLFTCRVQGEGLTFVEVIISLDDRANMSKEEIALSVFLDSEGRRNISGKIRIPPGKETSKGDLVIYSKGKWQRQLRVGSFNTTDNPPNCQIELRTYFRIRSPDIVLESRNGDYPNL